MIPYIGICDFPNRDQTLKTARFFQKLCLTQGLNRKLMVGVMMSLKTMTGQPSKWATAWPKNEEVAKIFIDHPAVLNTLHYADYAGDSSLSDFFAAAGWGGPRLQAIQLDMIWPRYRYVSDLKSYLPHLKIIVQVNAHALDYVNNDPKLLIHKLERYGHSIDYILLDKSHGRGVEMNAQELLPFLREISKHLPKIGLGVAGGLGPNTIDLIQPIIDEFPDVSIDAQGKLRPSGSALDPIDWEMAHDYLTKSVQMFACLLPDSV